MWGARLEVAMADLKTNVLYYGDNLDILREHVPDESIDLIYLDPPFNSNRSYNVLFRDSYADGNTRGTDAHTYSHAGWPDANAHTYSHAGRPALPPEHRRSSPAGRSPLDPAAAWLGSEQPRRYHICPEPPGK
jgi:site-specific DNA-methyltransferase (adenine-specific)